MTLAAWLVAFAAPAWALRVAPLYDVSVLGGQNFFSGQKRDFTGNASARLAPAMELDGRWTLIPALETSYQGSQQSVDIAGSGALFQEQWDNRMALKGVYARPGTPWLIKPSMGFEYQFLRQSAEDGLGTGLFDYYQWHGGAEAEFLYREPYGLRASAEYFQTVFPNYESLEGQTGGLGLQGLARELAGGRILDSQNFALGLSGEAPVSGRLLWDTRASLVYQHFPNQRVVNSGGGLDSPLREDFTTTLSSRLSLAPSLNPDWRVLGGVEASLSYDASSQNRFDAGQARFFSHYYSYGELKFSPSLTFRPRAPRHGPTLGLQATWWYRRYPYRLAQDENGLYGVEELQTGNWALSARLAYPLAPGFSLISRLEYGRSSSNQRFERFYRYNYSTASYVIGLEWGN